MRRLDPIQAVKSCEILANRLLASNGLPSCAIFDNATPDSNTRKRL